MKAKKSEKANLENKRGLYFQLGLIISLCLSLSAFEWSSAGGKERKIKGELKEEPMYTVDFVIPQQKQQNANKTVNKAKEPSIKIEVVKKEKPEAKEIDSSFLKNIIGDDGEEKPEIEKITFVDPNITYPAHEVSKSPGFVGGEAAIREYINSAIRVPQITIDKGASVLIYLSFVVNSKGKVVDVKFENGKASNQLKQEAIRVLSNMPDWEPGEKDGSPVSVMQYIPINVVVK